MTLSRTHPTLVKKLFALEVPEIADGSVVIEAIAREAGHRTKIAVRSTRAGLNPKGACIGPMGSRVRNVMAELHGEKIDIVDWSDDPAEMVANALSPARVSKVEIVDLGARSARVTVPDYQLSLAIGKGGRTPAPARLTGWRIDIRPDTETDEERENADRERAERPGSARKGVDPERSREWTGRTPLRSRQHPFDFCPKAVRSVRGGRLKRVWPDASPRLPRAHLCGVPGASGQERAAAHRGGRGRLRP
ncbi:Transcription termination/antitermination protein NusA [Streptomyces californicus]